MFSDGHLEMGALLTAQKVRNSMSFHKGSVAPGRLRAGIEGRTFPTGASSTR
jgi:hypothetical protein